MNIYDQIRQLAFSLDPPNQITPQLVQLANEAQAEAERLEKELAEAHELGDAMRDEWQKCMEKLEAEDRLNQIIAGHRDDYRKELRAAESQVKELAEALEKIIDLNSGSLPLPWDTQNIARAALSRLVSADRRTGDTSSQ